MTLKRVLKTLDEAPEAVRSFYKQVGEEFVLQVDGKDVEDVTALKNAKDHEKNLRVAAETKVTELTEQVGTLTTERDGLKTDLETEKGKKGADVQALETSWQAKLTAEQDGRKADNDANAAVIEKLLVTNTAQAMANEISTVPELFQDVIAKRLKVERGADGQPFTRVLDAAGQPSASTLDDLRKELVANEKYSAIIVAGKGSGGGAGGTGSGGGATEKKWLDHSDAELSELRRTDRDKYDRLKKAHQDETAAAGAS